MDCAKWFKYVACVIVYNSRGDVFLGKRKDGEAEGGKWAILGGSGAFGESKSRLDFAKREVEYGVSIKIEFARLQLFSTKVYGDRHSSVIKDDFCYKENGEIAVTGNDKAPVEGRWFSMDEIQKMAERGEIAFDNYQTLQFFEKQILKRQVFKWLVFFIRVVILFDTS